MNINHLHSWNVTIKEARAIQHKLSTHVQAIPLSGDIKYIAGIDVSMSRFDKTGRAAAVVVNYPELELVEIRTSECPVTFPYIPGLLSFREAPLALEACNALDTEPDLVMVDGQGIAHPRRLGFASHLGLCLDIPTIGCAKSRLTGTHAEVPASRGSVSLLYDNDEVIGAAVRTKKNVKPLYISVGHKIDLTSAIQWVLQCCSDYRLPQPTRLAHLASKGLLKVAPH